MTHAEYADSLRKIAAWFEVHPEVKLPHNAERFDYFSATDKEKMVMVARALGTCEKNYMEGLFTLKKKFGEITFEATCQRSQVCERVVVGKRDVPATTTTIAAHQEDIVEWKCVEAPLLTTKEPIPIDAPLAQAIRHDQLVEREADANGI